MSELIPCDDSPARSLELSRTIHDEEYNNISMVIANLGFEPPQCDYLDTLLAEERIVHYTMACEQSYRHTMADNPDCDELRLLQGFALSLARFYYSLGYHSQADHELSWLIADIDHSGDATHRDTVVAYLDIVRRDARSSWLARTALPPAV